MAFNLRDLLVNVFDPQEGEIVLVACDIPHGGIPDTPSVAGSRDPWPPDGGSFRETRTGARVRDQAIARLRRNGGSWANLPAKGVQSGVEILLDEVLAQSTLRHS